MTSGNMQNRLLAVKLFMDSSFNEVMTQLQSSLKELTVAEFQSEYKHYLDAFQAVSEFNKKLKNVFELRESMDENPDENLDCSEMEKLSLNDRSVEDTENHEDLHNKEKQPEKSTTNIPSRTAQTEVESVVETILDNTQTIIEEVEDSIPAQANEGDRPKKFTKEKTEKIICSEGGKISLHGCSVSFPKNAVKREKTFELTVTDKCEHFLPDFTAITPLLSLAPCTTFAEPLTVSMTTYNKTKTPVRVLTQDEGGKWKETMLNMTGQQIRIEVCCCCNVVVVVRRCRLFNDVYIQKGTANITAIFSSEAQILEKYRNFLIMQDTHALMSFDREVSCTLDSTYLVDVKCTVPERAEYKGAVKHPAKFAVTNETMKKRHICLDFAVTGLPPDYTGDIAANYSVTTKNEGSWQKENDHGDTEAGLSAFLSVYWPIGAKYQVHYHYDNIAAGNFVAGGKADFNYVDCPLKVIKH